MPVNKELYLSLTKELSRKNVTLVAVSKTKSVEEILELYNLGQLDFGENYVQELTGKAKLLPADIRWHYIGHLQTNKVKLIVPLVQLIQGVDSLKLLKEIDKEAGKAGKKMDCLLQIYIATEETKFGLDETELNDLVNSLSGLKNVFVRGFMGMASFTDDLNRVRNEFRNLKKLFDKHEVQQTSNYKLQTLSIGMSADYQIGIEEGSTMVRIGSLLFGERD